MVVEETVTELFVINVVTVTNKYVMIMLKILRTGMRKNTIKLVVSTLWRDPKLIRTAVIY